MPEIREVGESVFLIRHNISPDKPSLKAKDYPSLWVHIDAAWAGVALSCDEYRKELYLDEINSFANSFCTNFHKVRCPPLLSLLKVLADL